LGSEVRTKRMGGDKGKLQNVKELVIDLKSDRAMEDL
jgi:hypothetical protein